MTILLWVFSILIIIFSILFWLILKAFKNPVRQHDKTPDDMGISFQEISIPTKNKRSLYGWRIPSKEHAPLLILVHGWGRNAGRMMPYIENYHTAGFNVIAFDARNHGSSDADQHSTMLKFSEDIQATIGFADKNGWISNDKVGVVGLSIGGAASIHAAAHDKRIKAVIAVGSFADPQTVMKKQLKDRHIPMPIIWVSIKYIQYKVGLKFSDIAPVNHIQNATADILLIHGEKDVTVPLEQGEKLYKKGKDGKISFWRMPERGHSDCHYETGFWNKTTDFLQNKIA